MAVTVSRATFARLQFKARKLDRVIAVLWADGPDTKWSADTIEAVGRALAAFRPTAPQALSEPPK